MNKYKQFEIVYYILNEYEKCTIVDIIEQQEEIIYIIESFINNKTYCVKEKDITKNNIN